MRSLQIALLLLGLLNATAQEPVDLVAYLHGPNEASPYYGAPIGIFSLQGTNLEFFIGSGTIDSVPTGGGVYGPDGQLIFPFGGYLYDSPYPPFPGEYDTSGGYVLSQQQADQLRAGLDYVIVTTERFPEGGLRGQICPRTLDSDCDFDGVPDRIDLCEDTRPGDPVDHNGCSPEQLQSGAYFVTYLYGGNIVPPAGSLHSGYGTFWFNMGGFRYSVWFPTNFEPTRVSVHSAVDRGYGTSVIFDLSRAPAHDDVILYRGIQGLYPWDVDDLYSGLLYVTAESAQFPHRQLRGEICQLTPENNCDPIQQLCPCDGSWKSHLDYLRCVYDQARRLWKEQRITLEQRNAIMRAAKFTDCGHP